MKLKVILLAALMITAAGALASCGAEEEVPDGTTDSPTVAESVALPEETEEATVGAMEVSTAKIDETTTKTVTTKAPETTTAKGETAPGDIAAAIARGAAFEESLSKASSSRALSLFGINTADISEAAYYAASAAVAEEILVVKAVDSAAAGRVAAGMESRRETQIEDYRDYVPKEVPKLESAVIYTNGNYVVFCVSNDNSGAKALINGLF